MAELTIQQIFQPVFQGLNEPEFLTDEWTNCNNRRLFMFVLHFKYVATQRRLWSKTVAKFRTFSPL